MTQKLHSAYIVGPPVTACSATGSITVPAAGSPFSAWNCRPRGTKSAAGWPLRLSPRRGVRLFQSAAEQDLRDDALDVREPEPRRVRGRLPAAGAHGLRRGCARHHSRRSTTTNGRVLTKWAEDWRDVQTRTATCPIPRPPIGAAAALVERVLHPPALGVYKRYGDTRVLRENFPTMQRWLAFLETKRGQSAGALGRRVGLPGRLALAGRARREWRHAGDAVLQQLLLGLRPGNSRASPMSSARSRPLPPTAPVPRRFALPSTRTSFARGARLCQRRTGVPGGGLARGFLRQRSAPPSGSD